MSERTVGLTRGQFAAILAIVVAQFLFAEGAIWRHPFEADAAILWSYATIPVLVAGLLAATRRWTVKWFLLDVLAMAVSKFVVTAGILTVVLAARPAPGRGELGGMGTPPVRQATTTAGAAPVTAAAPVPTVIPPERTGAIRGSVVDAAGAPVAGALVWIDGGLDGMVFAAAAAPVTLVNDGGGFAPRLAAVEVREPLILRATDGRLHDLRAARGGDTLVNRAVLAGGAPTELDLAEPLGLVTVTCGVSAHGGEMPGRLLVVPHPFHAVTDGKGQFHWDGVPAGRMHLRAVVDGGTVGHEGVGAVDVVGKNVAEVTITAP